MRATSAPQRRRKPAKLLGDVVPARAHRAALGRGAKHTARGCGANLRLFLALAILVAACATPSRGDEQRHDLAPTPADTLAEGGSTAGSPTSEPGMAEDRGDVDSTTSKPEGAIQDGTTGGANGGDTVTSGMTDSGVAVAPEDGGAEGPTPASTATSGPTDQVIVVVEEGPGLCAIDGTVQSQASGFAGDGYVDSQGVPGAAVVWAIDAKWTGAAILSWAFSNLGPAPLPARLFVNELDAGLLDFPPTGNWSSWSSVAHDVELIAGSNTIRLEATTAGSLGHIDALTAVGSGLSAGACQLTPPSVDTKPAGPPLAFPGAEGFGRMTSGGRGGQIYHVTNLDDSGAGSFRDAVSQPGRIVVFDVGGVINITTRIVVHKDITVAGQTAPGGGVTLFGNGIAFNGDSGNDIIRFIRVRMGKNGDSQKDAVAISEGQGYMFDHVSISWGRDGTLDVNGTGVDDLSFQETIISQGINSDNHSTGGLMQSGKWSVIRSLYIDNKTRNPKARGTHEFINSVLYNWGTNGYIMGDTSGVSESNLVGNYFIYGPSSSSDSHITNTTPTFYVYADDNWVDSNRNGVLDGVLLSNYKTATVVDTPFDYPAGVSDKLSAAEALAHVLDHAGASLVRDAVDKLLVEQLRSYGTEGQIINTEDDNSIPGGVGSVENGTAPLDTDQDGMPDAWESARGLDPTRADDGGDDDGDGYTNIEEYLSCMAGDPGC